MGSWLLGTGRFLGAMALLLLVVSCTGSKPGADSKTVKIGFVLATLNEERYAKDRAYFEKAAEALGAKVEFASCDDKVAIQTAKVETLLAKGVDVLVIQPVNSEAASSLVTMAKRDGVPVVAYDRIIKNGPLDAYVTQNSFEVGVLQAKEAVEATGGKGNFVLLLGESGHSVAEEITRGVDSILAKYPNVKIVVRQNHPGWSTALALSTVENALTRYKNKIDAVLANNDGMALGAIQALQEQKLAGKVFVAGADADLAAVQNLVRGNQRMTVLKGIRPLAEAAVKTAIALAKGEPVQSDTSVFNGQVQVPVVNTPVTRVVKSNLDDTVFASGFHSRAAVLGNSNEAGE